MKLNVTEISNKFAEFKKLQPEPDINKTSIERNHKGGREFRKKRSIAFLMALSDPNPLQQKIRCSLGINAEDENINKYEKRFNTKVIQRNEQLLYVDINGMKVTGRIDGKTTENKLIEHKRRTNGFLPRIPLHERVQCHLYMHMINTEVTHLIETFGNHMRVHVIHFDDCLWHDILARIFVESN